MKKIFTILAVFVIGITFAQTTEHNTKVKLKKVDELPSITNTTKVLVKDSNDEIKYVEKSDLAPAYTHPDSGIATGTYNSLTVNEKGHVTSGSVAPYIAETPEIFTQIGIDTFEDNTLNGWATRGDANWTVITDGSTKVLQSGNLTTHRLETILEKTVTIPNAISDNGYVKFKYKSSSEGCCDKLVLYINGEFIWKSGDADENDWQEIIIVTNTGSKNLKFTFFTDGGTLIGQNKAWLDDISFGNMSAGIANDKLIEFKDVHIKGKLILDNPLTSYVNDNIKIGINSFKNISKKAYGNVAIGGITGEELTNGTENSFYGHSSGRLTTTGRRNAFYGYLSGSCNTVGEYNTMIGGASGRPGYDATRSTFSSVDSYMTFIGYYTGRQNNTFADNTNVLTNSTALGFNARIDKSNQVSLGNTAVTEVITYGDLINKRNGGGVILRSPNGTVYKLTVSDLGVLNIVLQ